MMDRDDTIVAISSPAGRARRGIVRLSGDEAVPLAKEIFLRNGPGLSELGGFCCVDGLVRVGSALELPARAYLFRAPRSYTRQDVIELHLPGSPEACAQVMAALTRAGARPAEPGEFTARAFFSGRIDLSEAEAVADVIHAEDGTRLRSAMAALGGTVHRLTSDAAGRIAEVLAEVEASVDLADEDLDFDDPSALAGSLKTIADDLQDVADKAAAIPERSDRPHVVLAGRANVGKSSLLNALTGLDRAIVSATAGTTRDVLSAPLELGDGAAVILQDVAGFLEPGDSLSAAADSAARSAVAGADAICFVSDPDDSDLADDGALVEQLRRLNPDAPMLLLINKTDLKRKPPRSRIDALCRRIGREPLMVSAATGQGLEDLHATLRDVLQLSTPAAGSAIGLHERQRVCLNRAADALNRASQLLGEAMEVSDVAELAAIDLREALAQLGGISGEIVTEDILGRIFARFCVGK